MKNKKPLFAYFGHHKCASMWINNIIGTICEESGLNHQVFYNNHQDFNYDLNNYIKKNKVDFLLYADACYRYVSALDGYKGFHVIRDPRDIAVSAYYSHLKTHSIKSGSELEEHRNKLKKLSKEEGLLLDMKFIEYVFNNLNEWDYSNPNILDIKMEELIKNPYNIFIEAFDFLELLDKEYSTMKKKTVFHFLSVINKIHSKNKTLMPFRLRNTSINGGVLLGTIYDYRFEKMTEGRRQGTEDIKSHYRKGVSGDWHNHFTKEHKEYFKKHYGALLIKLGYETDDNW